MIESSFQHHFRACENSDCRFRYPVTEQKNDTPICPKCGSPANVCAVVEHIKPAQVESEQSPTPSIILVLDNLRSIFNVGSIFRSSDGAGIIREIILCGTTPTPDHPKFQKTALGSQHSIPWRYATNALDVCCDIRTNKGKLWALEITAESKNLFSLSPAAMPHNTETLALVFGNEIAGIDPAILKISDLVYNIPLHGIKESLNVAIAASITIYYLYQQILMTPNIYTETDSNII